MSINKVMITGNLTRDAELRQTPSGTAVLNIGVAVNDRRRNAQSGEWEDYANFIDCTMFGRRAEGIAQYLTKGTKVAIEGRLHYSSWEDRNSGQRRSKVDVTVDEIEFMSSRNGGGNYGNDYQGGYSQGGGNYGGNAGGGNNNYGGNAGGGNYGGNQGGYGGNAAGNQGGYSQNYDNNAQQRSANIPEPPTPEAYNDEDIPF